MNENPLPNLGLRLYKSRSLTFELHPMEVPYRSSVSRRMTRSRSRNAAMDMPPPPPHAFHGYTGYAPADWMAGSSPGQQPDWDQYVPQPEATELSWPSAWSTDWEQTARANWRYNGSSSSSGAPPLFAARCSFSD